jgi:hypothetical protein
MAPVWSETGNTRIIGNNEWLHSNPHLREILRAIGGVELPSRSARSSRTDCGKYVCRTRGCNVPILPRASPMPQPVGRVRCRGVHPSRRIGLSALQSAPMSSLRSADSLPDTNSMTGSRRNGRSRRERLAIHRLTTRLMMSGRFPTNSASDLSSAADAVRPLLADSVEKLRFALCAKNLRSTETNHLRRGHRQRSMPVCGCTDRTFRRGPR